MKPIKISKTMTFKKAKTNQQHCVYCHKSMACNVGIILTNKADKITLKKNLLLHLGCVEGFCKLLKKSLKKHGKTLLSEAL